MEQKLKIDISNCNLIAIAGQKGSGKDTIARYIQMLYPNTFSTIKFAAPIKAACITLFGYTPEQMEDEILKEIVDPVLGFSPRKAMQYMGTEFGRNMLNMNLWVLLAEKHHQQNVSAGRKTIISDLRFENEREWVHRMGGTVIHVVSPNGSVSVDGHPSEIPLPVLESGNEYVIVNNKHLGISSFYNTLDGIFQ